MSSILLLLYIAFIFVCATPALVNGSHSHDYEPYSGCGKGKGGKGGKAGKGKSSKSAQGEGPDRQLDNTPDCDTVVLNDFDITPSSNDCIEIFDPALCEANNPYLYDPTEAPSEIFDNEVRRLHNDYPYAIEKEMSSPILTHVRRRRLKN